MRHYDFEKTEEAVEIGVTQAWGPNPLDPSAMSAIEHQVVYHRYPETDDLFYRLGDPWEGQPWLVRHGDLAIGVMRDDNGQLQLSVGKWETT